MSLCFADLFTPDMYKKLNFISKIKENKYIFVYAAVKTNFLDIVAKDGENAAVAAIVDQIYLKKISKRENSNIQTSIKRYWTDNREHLNTEIEQLENLLKSISEKSYLSNYFQVNLKQVRYLQKHFLLI